MIKTLMTAAAAIGLSVAPAAAQDAPVGAAEIFAEAEAACEADGGDLWGVSLCGPILIVEPASRRVLANRNGVSETLIESDGVFTGVLPPEVTVANTAVEWDGVRWTMVLAPLPDDPVGRRSLLMHEAWHRIQPQLNLPMASPAPAHLGAAEGRVLMRLEWRALGAALVAGDAIALRTAIRDALTFRAVRRSQAGPEAAEHERQLEMNEGLAEYTGIRLSGATDPRRDTSLTLRMAEQSDGFSRTFAYASGPAYGLLLDELSPQWRDGLRGDADLGALLGAVIGFEAPTGDLAEPVQESAARYEGEALAREELAAVAARDSVLAGYTARLVEGPTLTLPLQSMRISFDPNTVTPLPPHGTVYPTLTLTDAWGVLTVTDGALIDDTFQGAAVVAPVNAEALSGDGWTLSLNEGWRIVPSGSNGGFRVAPID